MGKKRIIAASVVAVLVAAGAGALALYPRAALLFAHGDVRELRRDAVHTRSPDRPKLLVLALDGVDRAMLYGMLKSGELPELSALLGGAANGELQHACPSERVVTVLPSVTIAAWTTLFTGVLPGVHGVPGNEFFAREERAMVAPAPVSFDDIAPTLAVYTEDALGARLDVPTVYEQMRAHDPGARIWVAMSQVYRGADKLLLAKRSVLSGAFAAVVRETVDERTARGIYAELDEEVLDAVVEELDEEKEIPDVLTVYVAGIDLFAHHADQGPDVARRAYLREVLAPKLARLRRVLEERGFLRDAFVVVVSDHGHTEVVRDARHALGTSREGEPPEVLERAGFRVRPFTWKVPEDADFQAVLAYNGAMASVHLADRSTCAEAGRACDWSRPPRLEEDVLPVARAFVDASRGGAGVPALRGTLDMVLVRRAAPAADGPYAVVEADGGLSSVREHLAAHPHPTYVDLERRLRHLGTGPHGHRAGDVLLVANNGNVDDPAARFYFASEVRSWHGSPSKQDSDVPLVVARRGRSRADLCAVVDEVLPEAPTLADVGRLLVRLREPTP